MNQKISDYDIKFMSYAINLSKLNRGITSPNPTVGAVIVKNNQIISTGVTAKNGRPHAEKIAIDKVENKEILQGATIYVTLEPCCHFGETSPCVDEIIKYEFKKVVVATQDSDARVNGQSLKKLFSQNIEVITGVLENEAQKINRGFFKSKHNNLPFVTLKIASSLDGKIALKNGESKWITNAKSRKFAHYLRSQNDAILVGGNTIRQDNPTLNCRINGLENYSPKPVIISNSLAFDKNLNIFQTSKPIILTSTNNINNVLNAQIINCTEDENNRIDLKDALQKLCKIGEINSVLVEGGSNVATQFLQQNLVDELIWIRSNKIIGSDGISAIQNLEINEVNKSLSNLTTTENIQFDDDIVEILRRKNN